MRVVIADDSALLREGIAGLLRDAGIDVVAAVGDAEQLLVAVAREQPDVAIVDIRMPPTNTDDGLRAAATLRHTHPRLGILLLSQFVHAGRALDLFRGTGAGLGYLLKDRVTEIDEFLDAVHRIGRGGSVIDPQVVSALIGAGSGTVLRRLTERERAVLALMAQGCSNTAIAERLHLAGKTVESHINAIFAKLHLEVTADDNRRVLAVLVYLREHQ